MNRTSPLRKHNSKVFLSPLLKEIESPKYPNSCQKRSKLSRKSFQNIDEEIPTSKQTKHEILRMNFSQI
jgi:hypothetical protein